MRKGSEEDDEERVPVVRNMEAGCSYLQTTYPRDVVEKIVIDELEERKIGRGSDGLVRGREYRSQTDETNGKGKGKAEEEGKKAKVKMSVERHSSNGTCDNWRKGGEHKRSMSRGMRRKRNVKMRRRTSKSGTWKKEKEEHAGGARGEESA